jgi:hypothetical protein
VSATPSTPGHRRAEGGAPRTSRHCVGEGVPSPRAYGCLRGRRICDGGRGRRVGARGLQARAQWLPQTGGAPLRPRRQKFSEARWSAKRTRGKSVTRRRANKRFLSSLPGLDLWQRDQPALRVARVNDRRQSFHFRVLHWGPVAGIATSPLPQLSPAFHLPPLFPMGFCFSVTLAKSGSPSTHITYFCDTRKPLEECRRRRVGTRGLQGEGASTSGRSWATRRRAGSLSIEHRAFGISQGTMGNARCSILDAH